MLNSFEKNGLPPDRARSLGHPDDVVHDGTLALAEKRAILASWASDAHAVVDAPALRQLDNGAVVDLDIILRALRSLDDEDAGESRAPRPVANPWRWRGVGRYGAILTRWRRTSNATRRRDDDDDPPPCPTSTALPLPTHLVPAYGRLVA